tara:strand:- start:145 stop:426 length:282 start_codon:yes stop_codon:yes gene_type:complete
VYEVNEMLHRTFTLDDNETVYFDVSWEVVRASRDQELKDTDWWALKDLTMSQAKKDYRKFLRDLPQNYFDETDEVTQGANAACDAWSAYEKPE